MTTSNPAMGRLELRAKVMTSPYDETMTIQGTINKTGILLLLTMLTATWCWRLAHGVGLGAVMPWLAIGTIGGLIVAVVTMFKTNWAGVTAPLYALLEGLVLGGLSAIFEARYTGIAFQAVFLTFGTLGVMLFAFKTGIIRVTDKFRAGIVAATGAIFLVYMASFVLGIFGVQIPQIFGSGIIGIGFSVVVVIIAALSLVLDFDMIQSAAYGRLPKYMEWYGAFALMVTLIWLYIEIIRLLAKLKDER
ncbi:MAG: Bax inhibitor-1/YccA family protein [Nitrospirae bacterium]|nr:Bax inhibitor-1/YccA family protein [Nitrospirota bacterium]